MPTELMIVGAGGHAKVVIEALQHNAIDIRILVADQDKSRQGDMLIGRIPIVYLDNWEAAPAGVHVAIGDNEQRKALCNEALQIGKELVSVIHPAAIVSPSSNIGDGSFIAAAALIAAEVQIGEACIINHAAIVDHDCCIGGFTHVGPNATLGGGVRIGHGCLIGSGATLLPGIRVGDNATVGSGSVVIADVGDGQTSVGVPAKCVKS